MSAHQPRPSREFPSGTAFTRLELDGLWTAYDLGALLADVSRLYDIRRGLDLPPMERREAVFDLRFGGWWAPLDLQPPSPFLPGFALAVVRVKYESPGFVDVAGVGKAIEQFRLFAQYLIDLVVNRSLRKLEADDVEQDVIAKRLRTPNASWTLESGRGN